MLKGARQKQPERVLAFMNMLGIPYADIEISPQRPGYNGVAVSTRRTTSDFIHDCAHWLLSPPRLRNKPDFGLGPDPAYGNARRDPSISKETAQELEYRASVLGIMIERSLDLPWTATLEEHGWTDNQTPAFERTIKRLIKSRKVKSRLMKSLLFGLREDFETVLQLATKSPRPSNVEQENERRTTNET